MVDLYTKFRDTGFVTSDQAIELEKISIDDFKSRTCENCKHCKEASFPELGHGVFKQRCTNIKSLTYGIRVDNNFGCNNFEAKENKP